MKIIQLNSWNFAYLNEIIAFLKSENPDIVNLQEVGTKGLGKQKDATEDPFEILKKELNMQGHFAPTVGQILENGDKAYFGNAFLTKLEILDYGSFSDKYFEDFKTYTESESPFNKTNKKDAYEAAFELPVNFLWATLKYKEQIIRNITSHFSVSFKCTETLQMVRQGRQVVDFINRGKEIPTIFSGDLNIHKDSVTVRNFETIMENVSMKVSNSLTPSIHPVFKDQTTGYGVDHVFQKGFKVVSCICPDVVISDHLPIVVEVELN